MVRHGKESLTFTYDLATVRQALRSTKAHRNGPDKADNRQLTAQRPGLFQYNSQISYFRP
jgi:hypothetical protein